MRIDVDVVNQDLLIPPEDKYVVEGTQEFIQFHFKLKDGWEDLTVFAQFIQNSSAYNVYLDSDNNVYLPPEIENGFVQIVLYGTYDETIAISNFLRLRVRRTPFIADGQSVVITESLYDQMVTMVDDFESSINDAIDALSGEVGDLTNLTTTTKISIVAAINELKGRIDTNQTAIGTLSSLTTTNKSNLVAAVNEVKSKADEIGVLSSLTTDAKSSAVAAINEVNGKVIDIENAEGLHKYGVSGIGQSASALTRIWDSVGMTAQVGTDGDNSNVINNFDDVKPFNRRKCVGTWELINGRPVFEVEAYLGDDDYTEDGTKGDYVAVECPKAYYYLKNGTLGISAHQWDSDWKPFDIFCHDHDPHQVMDYVYLPAYALAVKNGHAVSLPNLPNEQGHYQGLTNSARTYNGAVGAKAILQPAAVNFYEWAMTTVEFAVQNTQSVMAGASSLKSSNSDPAIFFDSTHVRVEYNVARVAGEYVAITTNTSHTTVDYKPTHKILSVTRCDADGNASSSGSYQKLEVEDLGMGYFTYDTSTTYYIAGRPYYTGSCNNVSTPSGSPVNNTNGYYPMKYRWRENIWGNQNKTAADLFNQRIQSGNDYYLKWFYILDPSSYTPSSSSKPDAADLATFHELGVQTEVANYKDGYIKSKKYDSEFPDIWIPDVTTGASTTTYFADYAYLVYSLAVRAVRFGGSWSNGALAGSSLVYAFYAPSYAFASYGGDLCFAQ